MLWLKILVDLAAASWMIWMACIALATVSTTRAYTTLWLKFLPIVLAFLLCMSHAKVFF